MICTWLSIRASSLYIGRRRGEFPVVWQVWNMRPSVSLMKKVPHLADLLIYGFGNASSLAT